MTGICKAFKKQKNLLLNLLKRDKKAPSDKLELSTKLIKQNQNWMGTHFNF